MQIVIQEAFHKVFLDLLECVIHVNLHMVTNRCNYFMIFLHRCSLVSCILYRVVNRVFWYINCAWDIVLVINGEKAAVNNPLFAQKRERTLEMLIKNIHQGYMMETNKVTYIVLFYVRYHSIFSIDEKGHHTFWLQTDKIHNANNKKKRKHFCC